MTSHYQKLMKATLYGAIFCHLCLPQQSMAQYGGGELRPATAGQEEDKDKSFSKGGDFLKDATLYGTVDYFQRRRNRYNITTGEYDRNLDHITAHTSLAFESGFANNIIGVDLGVYASGDLRNKGAIDHEMGFEPWRDPWHPDWTRTDTVTGVSFYKAHVKAKYGSFWGKAGYFQPTGPNVLGVNWGFSPGTYLGVEAGNDFNTEYGKLSTSYTVVTQYKAPWFRKTYSMYRNDGVNKIDYIWSVGARYAFNNHLTLEGAIGAAEGYLRLGHIKADYKMPLAEGTLNLAYQFYGQDDNDSTGGSNDISDGLAYQHVLRSSYDVGSWSLKGEMTYTRAPMNNPNQPGYFVYRPTTLYGGSNGAYDLWWDSRSDWNHDQEKAFFISATRSLSDLGLRGWTAGLSFAYGWGGKAYGVSETLKEYAYNATITYTVPSGRLKGAFLSLHGTIYKNRTDQPSWVGFKNAFQSEKDLKIFLTVPFSLF